MIGSCHGAGARALIAGTCLALVACGGEAGTDPDLRLLLDELRAHPGRLPHPPPQETGVVLLTVKLGGGRIESTGAPIPVGGTLGLQRGLARRRTSPPEYWALQTEAGSETVRYWTPLDPTPSLRLRIPNEGADPGRHEASLELPETLVPLRLPFFPGGAVTFRAADGSLAGNLLFDPEEIPEPRYRCPQAYRIHGTAPVERALNIVVLPAGFTEGELDDFRCGAGLMIERLLSFAPYSDYTDSINVYRIDLAATTSGVLGVKCHDPCEPEKLDWGAKNEECEVYSRDHPARATRLASDTAPEWRLDLDVRTCPKIAPYCKVLWPSAKGEHVLWRLASCAPAFDVVIVLANSEEFAGGGIETETHRLAVTTFRGIDTMANRSEILAHEFGHALGLLDEYANSVTYHHGTEPPDFLPGRNVVRAAADGTIGEVPWAASCRARRDDETPSPCQVICAHGCGACDRDPNAAGPAVGLYEGGFYQGCGYYRAANRCYMFKASHDLYCDACVLHLETLFEEDLEMRRGG